ncbi:unnamed protein product [Rotaria sp. Silwood2]|nr:unnamed protein product [Rotaria sp. Silwood2]CAF2509718.1 unnamed protein product [Rotaria sp. Silwood2]CAF2866783.1 unnamed protein product [Rotaria sp. Silwood2]CAF4471329.1 unnamed protein product [Rotaria sp. Silwood2]CAF4481084.1 unnamed protein product [Rotaria sp. Silwood2]
MQSPSNIIRNPTFSSELKSINGNNDDNQAPPPSYTSIIYKLENPSYQHDNNFFPLPPSYTDVNSPTIFYINNYPGPPLEDGIVQMNSSDPIALNQSRTTGYFLSKRMQTYFNINAVLMILFGIVTIGLQIGLIVTHSIVFYYYGFWAGAVIICLGICTIIFNTRSQQCNIVKYFHSYAWETVFIAVVLGFGIIIIAVDTCDDNLSTTDDNSGRCKHSYKQLNGLLIGFIAVTFLQTFINTLILTVMKRRVMRI